MPHQPDYYLVMKAVPWLGMSVEQIMALPPHKRKFWVSRAIMVANQEIEADRLRTVKADRDRA